MDSVVKEKLNLNLYDFDYVESYLSDMAAKGLVFMRFTGGSVEFEKSSPVKRRYRLIPKIRRTMMNEQIEMYEDAGWHYLCKKADFQLFYCDDEDVPEIFTDGDSFRRQAGRVIVALVAALVMMPLCILFYGNNILADYMEGNVGISILLLLALYVVVTIYWLLLPWYRGLKKMKHPESIDHGIDYEKKMEKVDTFRLVLILLVVIYLIVIAAMFAV